MLEYPSPALVTVIELIAPVEVTEATDAVAPEPPVPVAGVIVTAELTV
jgi:hypothetical protein